jgi:hypothetical protein
MPLSQHAQVRQPSRGHEAPARTAQAQRRQFIPVTGEQNPWTFFFAEAVGPMPVTALALVSVITRQSKLTVSLRLRR